MEFKAQKKEDQGFSGFTKEMARCAVEGDSSNCNCDLGVGSWYVFDSARSEDRVVRRWDLHFTEESVCENKSSM